MDLLIPMMTWLTLSFICQLSFYPFLLRVLPSIVAYSASKALGIIVFGYLVWVLGLLTGTQTIFLAIGILVAFTLSSFFFIKHEHTRIDWLPLPERHEILWIEGLFLLSFLSFISIYSTHPEIYWGEKPMDFSFLNYFTRLEKLPPTDPWASGNQLGYYYLGTLVISLFHKLSGIAPNFGFGIALAHIFSLLVVTIATIFLRLGVSTRIAAGSAAIAVLASDYDVLYLWGVVKQKLGFDLYWASSRTLTSPGMNEYPLWSMLFADLHAHVIALPFVALTILLSLNLAHSLLNADFYRYREKILWLSFSWGTLCALNTWDYLGVGVLIGLMFLLLMMDGLQYSKKHSMKIAGIGLSVLFLSIIFSLPFHLTIASGAHANWGYVYPEEFNTVGQIFRVHGHWLLLLVASFLTLAMTNVSSLGGFGRALGYTSISLLPLFVGVFTTKGAHIPAAPWGVLSIATFLSAIGAYYFFYSQKISIKSVGILTIAAGAIYTLAECFYLMDRMNTTFKTYHFIWTLLAISSLTYAYEAFIAVKSSQRKLLGFRIVLAAILIPSFFSSLLCIWIMSSFERIPSVRPTLNGTKYLSLFNPVEAEAFAWINKSIKGTPTIVEAFGPSYQEYSRFSMHTGLPLILGWEYHVQQRGTTDSDIRKEDIQKIYTSSQIHERMQALNRYTTQLIIVGRREREIYGQNVDEFFAKNPDYFSSVYQNSSDNQSIKIYRHRYSTIQIR